jgi:hypothetical protein
MLGVSAFMGMGALAFITAAWRPPLRHRRICMTEQPLLTRRQLVVYLNENGFPIGSGTISRLCSPAYNDGPPVAGWWGNRCLYDRQRALEWARAQVRSTGGPITDKLRMSQGGPRLDNRGDAARPGEIRYAHGVEPRQQPPDQPRD